MAMTVVKVMIIVWWCCGIRDCVWEGSDDGNGKKREETMVIVMVCGDNDTSHNNGDGPSFAKPK